MEQNQNNDESKRNPTEQSEGADQPLLGVGANHWYSEWDNAANQFYKEFFTINYIDAIFIIHTAILLWFTHIEMNAPILLNIISYSILNVIYRIKMRNK